MPLIIAAAAAPMLAGAQKPAEPPRAPKPSEQPSRPMLPKLSEMPSLFFDKFELEHQAELLKLNAQEMRLNVEEMHLQAKEMARFDAEHMKLATEEMRMHALDMTRGLDVEKLQFEAAELSKLALLDFPKGRDILVPGFAPKEKFLENRPRAAWASEDPADSLYRIAREALNRGEYRRAAQLFNEITTKYRQSQYALHSAYWEAFARYRTGGTEDLRSALKILDDWRTQFESLRSEGSVDVSALRMRVQGALAARGDQKAADELRRNAPENGNSCDREDISVRAEALSALGQMDPAAAMPVVKKVLERRDECTVELRRRALYLIGRQASAEAVPLILDVAKNDTDAGIRGEAMRWLPRVAGDNAVPQLEDLLRSASDEQTQRAAISALGSIDSERARRAVRTIIERNDANERVRQEAIISLSRERDGRSVTAEEQTYLRSLYAKLESPRLKEAVLTSVSRIGTPENEQFLLSIARNTNETPALRASALQRLGRMNTVGVNDIAKLYDVADSRSLREQILHALSQRKEPEAIDKIIEIAKRDTDPQVRRTALSLLGRSNNERAKQFLKEIFDK
jgi:HEAT repeat protein/TolA-binding protein